MKENIIVIYKDRPRIGSFLIAQGFERKHEHVVRLIKKYRHKFEIFCPLQVDKRKQKRGAPITEFLLDEDQFFLLGTLFKNSDIIVDFKARLIQEFAKARKLLANAKSRQSNQEWITSRDFGKKQRLALTDAIKDFVEYAKEQGSNNADWYYASFSKMTWGLLFVLDGKYKSARDMLGDQQLTTMASAEQIITKGLRDCMKAKTFYKDIYQDIKQRVLDFAGLTGQTKVIEEQLKLEE